MVEDMLLKPKKIEIVDNYVSLKLSIKVPREVVTKRGISNYKTKRVNAKIHNIEVIQYHATPFEKSNRVGRIIIYGRVVARDFYNDYVAAEHLPSSVEIFGVKDFESAISALKSVFPAAIIDEL